MKKSAQNRIIIWSIVSVLIIAILAAGFVVNAGGRFIPSINQRTHGEYYYTDTDSAYNQTDILEYSNGALSYINIYLSNGKVIFEESDTDTIEIVQLSSSSNDEIDYDDQFYYKYDGTSLWIFGSDADFDLDGQVFSSSDFTFAFENIFSNASSKTILVKIPKAAYLHSITTNTASADIEIDNINSDYFTINSFSGNINAISVKSPNISINNVSGTVDLSNITSDDFSVNNVSGDVDINGDIKTLTLESVSGDLYYSTDSLLTESISVNTVSGNANIRLPENSGFTVTNSSLSGDVKSRFQCRQVDEQYVYGDGSTQIELNSVSGSASINPTTDNKPEQNQNEKIETTTSPTASTSQIQSTTAKATKSND